MRENIIAKLTAKDDKYTCALADKIIAESQEADEWVEYFDDFASLHNADLSKYKDSMRPLIEKDIVETEKKLMHCD